jgi:hypothetical protein
MRASEMTYIAILAGFLLECLPMPGFSVEAVPFDSVNARVWPSGDPPSFPEIDDPRVKVPWLSERPSFGIAFSGGGNRAAAAALGQLRALNRLGWLDKARYLSANSGGSWAVWPYTYLDQGWADCVLGRYVGPSDIDDQVLRPDLNVTSLPEHCALSAAIYRSKFWTRLGSFRYGNEVYSDALGRMFLEPFGLNDRDKPFTFHRAALEAILDANPDDQNTHGTGLQERDFYCVTERRPYPVILGTLPAPADGSQGAHALFPIEATPIYTGVRDYEVVRGVLRAQPSWVPIGGGYIESFAYDSYEPKRIGRDGYARVKLKGQLQRGHLRFNRRYRFTLSDVIGMSGAAPAVAFEQISVPLTRLFPGYRHWSVARESIAEDPRLYQDALELLHGDGGDVDNLALSPLLARHVENILVLLNPDQAFNKAEDPNPCRYVDGKDMKNDLVAYFRDSSEAYARNFLTGPFPKHFIAQGETKLRELCEAFQRQRDSNDGKPLVHCDRYHIRSNKRFGIRGESYRPRICWLYLDYSNGWRKQLDAAGGKHTRRLKDGAKSFRRFPHYRTVGERPAFIDLDRKRVHALSNLTAWSLLTSQYEIATAFPDVALPTGRVDPNRSDDNFDEGCCRKLDRRRSTCTD